LILVAGAAALVLKRLPLAERLSLSAAPAVANLTGTFLKRITPRERPNKNRFSPEGGESYPSTHTACSLALGLTAAGIARAHGAGAWVWLLAAAWSALVGHERIEEAAHWPSDVLGGAALGIASWSVASAWQKAC